MQQIEQLYEKYFRVVYNYLYNVTHNRDIAEELAQDTFLIVLQIKEQFRKECKIESWLCQIAKFQWYGKLKKHKECYSIEEKFIGHLFSETDIERSVLEKEEEREIYEEIEKLGETTRKVMLLRIVKNMSFKKIAIIFGKEESWARVVFYRGKEKIKRAIKSRELTCFIAHD